MRFSFIPNRHDPGHRGFAIKHRVGLSAAHCAKLFSEMPLEFGDAYLLHDPMMTSNRLLRRKSVRTPLARWRGTKGRLWSFPSVGLGTPAATVRRVPSGA